jgi:hypothetical protein
MPAGEELPGEDADWTVAYSKVGGELPGEDFPIGDRVFAQGHVIVQVGGTAKLKFNNDAGVRIWIDGDEMGDPSDTIELAKGRRTLTFLIDRAGRGDQGLRVELLPAAGSNAKYQPEGGF